MLWDDTFEHEVWNDSLQVRTVLLLTFAGPRCLGGLLSPAPSSRWCGWNVR